MKKLFPYILSFIFGFASFSCDTNTHQHYVIGVSQCSEDIWRDKLNQELQTATYMEDGITIKFASADDNDKRQIQQIEQFISAGVNLLIISPN